MCLPGPRPALPQSHVWGATMNRSAPRFHTFPTATPRLQLGAGLSLLARIAICAAILVVIAVVAPGYILDTPQPAPRKSDAIVVISGDEQLARFAEGVNLYQQGFGSYLVFSGAAYDNGTSNADVMRDLAVRRGVPESAILEEPQGEDTWGNAIYTREVLEEHGLQSAILVTSPYHLRRAKATSERAFNA